MMDFVPIPLSSKILPIGFWDSLTNESRDAAANDYFFIPKSWVETQESDSRRRHQSDCRILLKASNQNATFIKMRHSDWWRLLEFDSWQYRYSYSLLWPVWHRMYKSGQPGFHAVKLYLMSCRKIGFQKRRKFPPPLYSVHTLFIIYYKWHMWLCYFSVQSKCSVTRLHTI